MSHGRRPRRGSGGHPARAARRRRQDAPQRAPDETRLAREIARAASSLGDALDAEMWASQLLGMFWVSRYELPLVEGAALDAPLEYGGPLLTALAGLDSPGAAIAILALAELDDGELGTLAKETLDRSGMWKRLPRWAADVGESEIVGAAVMRDSVFDDGQSVFLESRHPDGTMLTLGVYIDRNLGGMAKDVLIAESIEQVQETMRSHAGEQLVELVLDRLEPGVAAGLIREAIELTDITWDPPVEADYWNGRALAVLRCDQTRNVVAAPERVELPLAERRALHSEFLASPEGSVYATDGDDAWAALLAIDFAADYAGGDPLRWSPVVVELFMTDWVPRKVMTTDELLAALPTALDAWVRFAARKRGVPDVAAAVTREAIGEYAREMADRASDPAVAGPSKQFLLAAQRSDIDVEDAEALEGFIAGWNARSELEERSDLPDAGTAMAAAAMVLQVKITLARVTKPPVWRRLQLSGATRLDELHQIIQLAFGWTDSHLHVFATPTDHFGPMDPESELEDVTDERSVALAEIAAAMDTLTYTYDFGDEWRHEIVFEKVLEPDLAATYPRLLTAKGACPPEDCGGVWGWTDIKAVLGDPDAEQHVEVREWLGLSTSDVLDPTAVDPDEIRARLTAWATGATPP